MKTNEEIYKLIKEENITLAEMKLPQNKVGLYRNDIHGSFIFYNTSIVSNPAFFRCVIAEELGHHFTLITNLSSKLNRTYQNWINESKEEEQALRWATNYLISTAELLRTFHKEELSLYELSDVFNVTPEFVLMKLTYMSYDLKQWYISQNRLLCLTELPSISVGAIKDDSMVLRTKLETYRRLSCQSTSQKKQKNFV
jgi:Zn-dependent peptidase ImmA (M78 family)